MRKVFSVLTVAVLAVSTVFAGFGGSASIEAGANFDNGNFGFLDQGAGVAKVNVELTTENGEAKGEGDIYASIKGSLSLTLLTDKTANLGTAQVGVLASVDEAKVGGENWSVSILGMPGAPDYAKSGVDFVREGRKDAWGRPARGWKYNPVSYKAPYAKTNGVTVEVADYKVGLGILGDYNKDNTKVNAAVFAETPEYDFKGFTVKAGASYAYNEIKEFNDDGVALPAEKKTNAMGISAKLGYANEDLKLSASAATDVGIDFTADKDNVAADLAVNFAYDFLNLDFYYNSAKKNLVSLGLDVDLNSFKVPVVLSFTGKDLVNTQALGLEVETTPVEGLTVSAYGDYAIASKDWDGGFGVEYEAAKFTVAGGMDFAKAPEKCVMGANVSVESDAIINGATIGLGWSAADLLDVDPEEACNYGAVTATCTIEF